MAGQAGPSRRDMVEEDLDHDQRKYDNEGFKMDELPTIEEGEQTTEEGKLRKSHLFTYVICRFISTNIVACVRCIIFTTNLSLTFLDLVCTSRC